MRTSDCPCCGAARAICDNCGKVFPVTIKGHFSFCGLICSGKGFNPEQRRKNGIKAAAKIRGRPMTGRCAKGTGHHASKNWAVRDPRGRDWYFRNATEFVRAHADLFDPADLNWHPAKPGGVHNICRASDAISHLSPRRKKPIPSWKGWTWISVHERRFNDGTDLLNRKD